MALGAEFHKCPFLFSISRGGGWWPAGGQQAGGTVSPLPQVVCERSVLESGHCTRRDPVPSSAAPQI